MEDINQVSATILSNTSVYRTFTGIAGNFDGEDNVVKASALLFEKVYVDVVEGQYEDFCYYATRGISKINSERVNETFISLPNDGRQLGNMSSMLESKGVNLSKFEASLQNLNTSLGASSVFTDPHDPVCGEMNSAYSVILSIKHNLPYYDSMNRIKSHLNLFSEAGVETRIQPLDSFLPDVNVLSWDDIFELRAHKYWEDFRKQFVAGNVTTESEHQALRKIFRDVEESEESIVTRILSNIPIPFLINPIGVIRDIFAGISQNNRHKNHGWVYFSVDVQDMIGENKPKIVSGE